MRKSDSKYTTSDSGQREQYESGAKRDTEENKGRFDLIPWLSLDFFDLFQWEGPPSLSLYGAMTRLAQLYQRGAAKYDDHNWRKGIPTSRALSSMCRHAWQSAAAYTAGFTPYRVHPDLEKEDHLAAVVFNGLVILTQERARGFDLHAAIKASKSDKSLDLMRDAGVFIVDTVISVGEAIDLRYYEEFYHREGPTKEPPGEWVVRVANAVCRALIAMEKQEQAKLKSDLAPEEGAPIETLLS